MEKLRLAAATTVLCLAALVAPAAAAARTITLGAELIKPVTFNQGFSGPTTTVANPNPGNPNNPGIAPSNGEIVRWRLAAQPRPNVYRLTILHPAADGTYTATATSDPESASSTVTEVFDTELPIGAGDLIGLDVQSSEGPAIVGAYGGGNNQLVWVPSLGLGDPGVAPSLDENAIEFPFNADLVPVPEVTVVAPDSGPVGGGTAVVISGRDFSEVSGVSFGSVPASSYVVISENRIDAIAPPAVGTGPVAVTVANPAGAGTAAAAGRFTYLAPPSPPAPSTSTSSGSSTPTAGGTPEAPLARACKVPRLIGKTLPASRRILSRSRCRLGAVRGPRRLGKKVTRQSPRAGISRPPGWVVNVTIH
jgi:hypothetical protein